MTTQDQIKALAELDLRLHHGLNPNAAVHSYDGRKYYFCLNDGGMEQIPLLYLDSHDAIIPLIQKRRLKDKDFDEKFKEELWRIIQRDRCVMMPRVIEIVL